jgi:hypothetical protein
VLPTFGFSLICFLVPAALGLLGVGRDRIDPRRDFPIALAIHFGFLGIIGLVIARSFGFGPFQLAAAITVATGLTAATLRTIVHPDRAARHGRESRLSHLAILAILALAVLSVADLAFILSHQGWENEGGTNYFRNPMHTDGERNVVLVRAVARGPGSPFIANADLIYPVFWHNLAALLLEPVAQDVGFPEVAGVVLATAVVFFIMLYSVLLRERPGLARHWPLALLIVVVTATHADLYHVTISLFAQGSFGMEVDRTQTDIADYFRTFSPKLLALTSPQHVSFLVSILALYLLRRGRWANLDPRRMVGEGLLICTAVASSSVLAAMTLPLVYGLPALRRLHRSPRQSFQILSRAAILMLLSFLVFTAVYGYTPLALLDRPGAAGGATAFPGVDSVGKLVLLPLILVGISGVAGLLVCLWAPFRMAKHPAWALTTWPLLLVSGSLLFYYVVSSDEINRHWSVVASTAALIILVRCLPGWRALRSSLMLQFLCTVGVILALALHAVFIATLTVKPSTIDQQVTWRDYLCMNEVIADRYPGLAVAAAVLEKGQYFPLATRVTTSSAFTNNTAAVHSRLDPEQREIHDRIMEGEPLIDHAAALGYAAVIWGPIEDQAWGAERAASHARPELLMASCDSVGLYRQPEGPPGVSAP